MLGIFKVIIVAFLLILLSSPSLLRADDGKDPFYSLGSSLPNVPSYNSVSEHVDPFSGFLTLVHTDISLPGNGGLNLNIIRTYSSHIWGRRDISNPGIIAVNEKSPMGIGWSMHMGIVRNPAGSGSSNMFLPNNPIVEMPDGSSHVFYRDKNDQTRFISREFWIYKPITTSKWQLTLTDGTVYTFEYNTTAGYYTSDNVQVAQVTGIRNAANTASIQITYEHDTHGYSHLKTITDSVGRLVQFYYSSDLLSSITVNSRTFHYYYQTISGMNFLNQVTPPEGNPWSWSYSYYGTTYDLQTITFPGGGTITYSYNDVYFDTGATNVSFRVVTQRTTGGRGIPLGTWTYQYNSGGSSGDITTITGPNGFSEIHKFNGWGNCPSQGSCNYVWEIGLPKSKDTYLSGSLILSESYSWNMGTLVSNDTIGNAGWTGTGGYISQTGIYVPFLSSHAITRDGKTYTTNYSNYDNYGNPQTISETGDQTRTTSIIYWTNTTNNIVKGKPSSETVTGSYAGSFTTSYTYYSDSGNPATITKYGVETDYTYDSYGNLYSKKDANAHMTYYGWSNGSISSITNQIYGITRQINSNGLIDYEENGRRYRTYYSYDGNLRLKTVTPLVGNPTNYTYAPDGSYVYESRGSFYTYHYLDGFGRPSGTQDSIGVATSIQYKSYGPKDWTASNTGDTVYYDYFGRKKTVVHQDTNSITYSYSGSDVTVADEYNNPTYLYYDAFGNPDEKLLVEVKEVIDGVSNSTLYNYNIVGSLMSITQGSLARTFHYNSKNFLDWETHPEKGTINYGRDNVGNMSSKTDALGLVSYRYDELDRLRYIDYGSNEISFGYDNADNRTGMTTPSISVTYIYDEVNRLRYKNETIVGNAYSTEYRYNGNDYITDIIYPSSRHVIYAYNGNNQVTSVTGFCSGCSISGPISYYTTGTYLGLPSSFIYSNNLVNSFIYNSRNLVTQLKAGVSTMDMGYGYDYKGNTTAITNNLESKSQSLTYDSINRLKTFDSNGLWGTGSLYYDASGNRTNKAVAGASTTYNYSSNRLTSTTGGEQFSLGYNGSGDITSLNGYTLSYDQLHNLTSYSQGGTTIAEFGYDGDGMRITKSTGNNTIVYHHDQGGRLLSENYSDGVLIADYVYLFGKLAAKVAATPAISIAPASKDFGGINIGSSQSQTFTISNTGTSYLSVSTVSITGGNASEFGKGTDNCTGQSLVPNASCTVQILFSPATIGAKNASLSIASNDPDSPTLNTALSGTGVVTLTISKSGTGTGTVTSTPAGISCGSNCTETLSQPTTVTLTASPDACADFAGWSGGGCSGTGDCTVTMNGSNVNVTAIFNYKSLTASFTASPDTGGAPFAVTLADQSSYCPASWAWTFGDGSTSTLQNPPSHLFSNVGAYTVTLTVTNAIGNTSTATKTITAQACQNAPVRIGSNYYPSLQAAYNAANSGDVIQAQAITFVENVTINKNISVTLQGGYTCDYSSYSGNTTTLKGQLQTLSGGGTLTIKNFMLTQ